jgi:ankyrin repeat protein
MPTFRATPIFLAAVIGLILAPVVLSGCEAPKKKRSPEPTVSRSKKPQARTLEEQTLDAALVTAVENGDAMEVSSLLGRRASPNATGSKRDPGDPSPLTIAATEGHTEVADLLIDHGADMNYRERHGGFTPLIRAAQSGHTETVKLLLARGAKANLRDEWKGHTALEWAVRNQHVETLKALLEGGADISQDHQGGTALTTAAYEGYTEIVRVLLDARADLNATLKNGQSALTFAAEQGHLQIVRLLLDRGADPNMVRDPNKARHTTCLFLAASRGHTDIVKLFIERGADVNARQYTNTALMDAAAKGDAATVEVLLAAGADPARKDSRDMNALDLAVKYGHGDVAALLGDADAVAEAWKVRPVKLWLRSVKREGSDFRVRLRGEWMAEGAGTAEDLALIVASVSKSHIFYKSEKIARFTDFTMDEKGIIEFLMTEADRDAFPGLSVTIYLVRKEDVGDVGRRWLRYLRHLDEKPVSNILDLVLR